MSANLELMVQEHTKIAGTIGRDQEPLKLAADLLRVTLDSLQVTPLAPVHIEKARHSLAHAGALVLVEKDHCIAAHLPCDEANALRNKILAAMEGLPS